MKIFIADYLPLLNKGEEEILRGIEALFSKNKTDLINFCVFGDVQQKCQIGNVTIYPRDICYPEEKCSKGKLKTIIGLLWAFLGYIGLYPYAIKIKREKELMEEFSSSDHILLAHDGFLNLRCAILGNFLFKQGLNYAILGAGFNEPSRKIAWIYNRVYKRFFDHADYIILRETIAYSYVNRISKNAKIELLPDPAFFCPTDRYNKDLVESIQKKYKIDDDCFYKIGLTVCEDSISFVKAFLGYPNKKQAHREFIKSILISLSQHRQSAFYFLPHCIKEGNGNDLDIAKNIKSLLPETINCFIIEEDMPVLDLKHIISKMDLIIGERTHSIINSIATATPFVSLTCSADFRTHDIIGTGCGCPQQIIDLDIPDHNRTIRIIEDTIANEQFLIGFLKKLCLYHESLKMHFQTIIWN